MREREVGTVTGRPRGRTGPVTWIRAHPTSADALLAVVLTGVMVAVHLADFDPDEEFRDPTWWSTVLAFVSVFPIAWRRRRPVGSTVLVVAAQVIASFADTVGGGFLGVVIALYSLGAHAEGPARSRTLVGSTITIGLLFVAGVSVHEIDLGSLITSTVILVTAFVLGDNLRRRRQAADDLQSRLERAERERDLLAQQRVADERSRIARELHDVVAHSVTGMVIQAAAARRSLDRSPADAAEALDRIESTGRRTMNELRSVLGVLRRDDDGGTRAPQPGVARLGELVTSSSDLPLDLTISGIDADGLVLSDPGVDLTIFRLVQEALTNVRRHAGRVTSVAVEVVHENEDVVVTVTDDGEGVTARDDEPGYGLVGMRERVDAVGGTLRAGPWGSRGWQLHARLPVTAPAAVPSHASSTRSAVGDDTTWST